jgi:hypothetical protein
MPAALSIPEQIIELSVPLQQTPANTIRAGNVPLQPAIVSHLSQKDKTTAPEQGNQQPL